MTTTPIPGHDEDFVGDPESVARMLILRQLDARARTRNELERYLARKGVPEEPARRVLDRFVQVGLVDDRALAAAYVTSRHHEQGLARRALAQKLRMRGIEDSVAAEAIEQVDSESELEAARRLVTKRMRSLGGLEADVQVRRLVGLLGRKGYSSGLAYQVVREHISELADHDVTDD
ncbi:MAG: Regulatory protein RecX [Pseudonocardiales bacterium]|nr:Regulatory protein RecX [Pseudonocardiales bacterium]